MKSRVYPSTGWGIWMRVLTSVPRWRGHEAADLSAEFYDEILHLSRFLPKIYVLTDERAGGAEAGGRVEVVGVRTVRAPRLYGFSKVFGYGLALLRLVLGGRVDVVYVRQFSPPDLLLCVLARIMRKPSVLLLGGTWLFAGPRTLRNMLYRLVLRLGVKASSRVILYSPLMRGEVERFAGRIPKRKIAYVRNGVDVERFRPGAALDGRLLRRWGIGAEDAVLLYVGRVNEKKGVEEIVRAVRVVAERGIDVKALLVGLVEEGYRRRLEELTRRLGVEGRVVLAGPVAHRRLPEIYCASTLFVFMSRGGEGIPRAMLEAMACGRAVVATPVAGVPDVVRDGESGVLVPVGGYEALAEAVAGLISNRERREALGARARELVAANHSWGVVAPRLAGCLAVGGRQLPRSSPKVGGARLR